LKSPYAVLADIINSRPWIVAGCVVGIILIALYGTSLLTMETGTETYLDPDTPRGALLNKYTDTFSSDSIILIIEADNVLDPNNLEYLDRLEGSIRSQPYVEGTSSIINLLKASNNGNLPGSSAEISQMTKYVPAELLDQYLPSGLMTISVVTLQPGTSTETQNEILDTIDSKVIFLEPPPGLAVTVSGNPAFQKQMGEEIGSSTGTLILAAMALMVLAVGLLFSHVRYRFLPVAVVACGLVLTFGIMGLAGIPLSMVVIGAFPVLIGIGIDYAIQFQSRFDEEVQKSSITDAVKTTLTRSGPAILFAMIATALGFIAMFIAPVPMVGDFGFTCVIGVVSCYLAALFIVPTFGVLIKYRPKEGTAKKSQSVMDHYDRALGSLALNIAKHPVVVILALGLIAVVGIQLDATIPINTNEDSFVPSDMPAVVDMNKVTRTMGSTSTLPVYIRGDDVLALDTIIWIQEFGDYEVSHNEKITGATSIVTYLTQYNGGVMPTTEYEVRQVLERIPDGTKDRYVSGNTDTVIQFSLVDMENEVALALVDRVNGDLTWKQPPAGVTAVITGQLDMFTTLIEDIKQSKTEMTLFGFALIFTFLLLVYRKITAISPLIPIIMIVGWNGVIMYVLGIEYSPMTAVLGSMSIGVASEYTILIMERCQEERSGGKDLYAAIRESVQKIGTAVTVSGMTTVFGFSALLLSSFNIIQNFGTVTVITVGFSLIGAIVVMPAVMSLMGRIGQCEIPETKPLSDAN
jgi:hydrophobe/amphiphile efflux-3 (HAE3) family protein